MDVSTIRRRMVDNSSYVEGFRLGRALLTKHHGFDTQVWKETLPETNDYYDNYHALKTLISSDKYKKYCVEDLTSVNMKDN